MFVAAVFAPTVVDDDFFLRGGFVKQPREELFGFPVFGRHVPLAIGEDDRRRVAGDDVFELRCHVLGDVARAIGEPERIVPFVERVIETKFQARGAGGVGEFAHEVTLGANLGGVPWAAPGAAGFGARPQRETFVVLGGWDDVFHAGAREEIRPLFGVEELGGEFRCEVFVIEIGTVIFGVEGAPVGPFGLFARDAVPIPLRVFAFLAVGGNGVDAPVNENAELGVEKPRGRGAGVERGPIGFKFFRRDFGGAQRGRERNQCEERDCGNETGANAGAEQEHSREGFFGGVVSLEIKRAEREVFTVRLRQRRGVAALR